MFFFLDILEQSCFFVRGGRQVKTPDLIGAAGVMLDLDFHLLRGDPGHPQAQYG